MAVRQRRAALAEEAAAGALRTPRLHGSMRGAPAKVLRGSGRSGNHRRRGIARAERLTGGGFRSNSGTARAQGRGQKLREASWRRGGATAGDVVAWGAAERPDHGETEATGAGKEGGGGAGDLRGCRAGVRVLGAQEVPFVGRRRCLGVRAQREWLAGDLGKELRRRRKGREKGPTGGVRLRE
jgi:hypothetical protein